MLGMVADRLCQACGYRLADEVEDTGVRICDSCVSDQEGPGRYQGSDVALTWALEYIAGNDGADDFCSNEGWGYLARIGRHLFVSDPQGFVSGESFTDEAAAVKAFNDAYMDGWGADEYDAYIVWDRDGYGVSFNGRYEGKFRTERRARAKVSLLMRESGYFPDIWEESDRGSLRHIGHEVW